MASLTPVMAAETETTGGLEELLTVGSGVVKGTTADMEYHTDPEAKKGWTACAKGKTSLEPGSYYVRYAATETETASESVHIVVEKLAQDAPGKVTGGAGALQGTTTDMEYNTDPEADSGWELCDGDATIVTPGAYFVRFFETAKYAASDSTAVTVGKWAQIAPSWLEGGAGAIEGTTPEMEYSASSAGGWKTCATDRTVVSPGAYYVRYAAGGDYSASDTVKVTVAAAPAAAESGLIAQSAADAMLAPQEATALTVYNNGALVKGFTQSELDVLLIDQGVGPYAYSAYNTYPTYETDADMTGLKLLELLRAAGVPVDGLLSKQGIKLTGRDTVYGSITVGQLREARYFFGADGTKGAEVPAILSFAAGSDYPRLLFGQAAATEQIRQAYVKKINRIDVQGDAGLWDSPTAMPATGTQVRAGSEIRLATPTGYPDGAKIYYTLDGSEPSKTGATSKLYNRVGESWLGNHGMTENDPIIVPDGSGTLTVKAKIIGIGKNDGPTATFLYNYAGGTGLLDQAPPTGLIGGKGVITGTTAAMQYNTSASAATGWVACSGPSTSVIAGTYYVRYAATSVYNASAAVSVTVSKQDRAAPGGISGGAGVINGTTTGMEYNTNASAANGWVVCASGSTGVAAGTYYVRYAATSVYNASPAVAVTVGKMDQAAPSGITGGAGVMEGTTTAMQYNTSTGAASGWAACSNESTSVAAGTYYVRYAATDFYNASPTVTVTVKAAKQAQSAPSGLAGGKGVITGTTTAMQYNTDSSATSGWITCSGGSTRVEAGTYYVRYAATNTQNASPSVMVTVDAGGNTGETVIAVYSGGKMVKGFTKKDIDSLPKYGPSTYSYYNTWPTYETYGGIIGVRVLDLLSTAGVGNLPAGQSIKFVSADNYSESMTVGQLGEARYFFSSSGARGAQVQSVIAFGEGSDYPRLILGQAAAQEQTQQVHVKKVARIEVEGGAGSWGSASASPASGSAVGKGDLIRLSASGDAKIYYTLDGSEPTRSSAMYNIVAARWLFQKGMEENQPIVAPGGAFTLKAKVMGLGKSDGPTVTFQYNAAGGTGAGTRGGEPGNAGQGNTVATTVEDLENGNVAVTPGESFFVPAEEGSITWNADEMDGYYDPELGGYVFTPKVDGNIAFTYTDEEGKEHMLSVDSVALAPGETPGAVGGVLADGGANGNGTDGGQGGGSVTVPLWVITTGCVAVGLLAGGWLLVLRPRMPSAGSRKKSRPKAAA